MGWTGGEVVRTRGKEGVEVGVEVVGWCGGVIDCRARVGVQYSARISTLLSWNSPRSSRMKLDYIHFNFV